MRGLLATTTCSAHLQTVQRSWCLIALSEKTPRAGPRPSPAHLPRETYGRLTTDVVSRELITVLQSFRNLHHLARIYALYIEIHRECLDTCKYSVFWIDGSPRFRLALCRVSSSILFATRTTSMSRSRIQNPPIWLARGAVQERLALCARQKRLWTAQKPIFPGPVAVVSRFPDRGTRVAARVNVVQDILQGLWGVQHKNFLWYMWRWISAARSFGGQGRE
jgi:hypothetical protein